MIKKSLAVIALASFVAVGACKKADDTETLGADTTVVPAAPIAPDTMAAPMTADTGIVGDTTVVDTAATTPAP
jgi:hypothetical protein